MACRRRLTPTHRQQGLDVLRHIVAQPNRVGHHDIKAEVCPPGLPSRCVANTNGLFVTSALIWHQPALRVAPPFPIHSLTVTPLRSAIFRLW